MHTSITDPRLVDCDGGKVLLISLSAKTPTTVSEKGRPTLAAEPLAPSLSAATAAPRAARLRLAYDSAQLGRQGSASRPARVSIRVVSSRKEVAHDRRIW